MLRYGSSYNEYLREVKDDIFDDRSIEDIGNRVVNLKTVVSHEYPKNIPDQNDLKALKINETQMSTIKKTYKMTTEISQDQLYQMIALYINLGLSFRELEKRVLNIDSKERGGGFIAKSALNNMGVTASHKGKIRTKDQLTKACEIYNDSFGKTLKELLKLINKSASLDYYKIFI